jgi:hypothetical protein
MAKKDVSPEELVETHKPKFVKYKYIFTDESLLTELLQLKYDMTTLDTIGNDALVNAALEAPFTEYDRTVVGKSTSPSFLDNGIIISKRLITKADKKLLKVSVGRFMFNDSQFVAIKFTYERFEIVEVFNLI